MSDKRITKFNQRVGKMPLAIHNEKEAIWKALKDQAERLVEEAQEVLDGVNNRDINEVLDGVVDTWYVREWMDDMLSALGIDVEASKHEVCMNNLNKITENVDEAYEAATEYGNCFVYTYHGKNNYYSVLREGDRKVMKLKTHIPPNLDQFIPITTKQALEN